MTDLARVPLQASVAEAWGVVELTVTFGERGCLTLLIVDPRLGSRECAALARNLARRLNRDGEMLPEEPR